MNISAFKILDFWFKKSKPNQWFDKDNVYDALIKSMFLNLHNQGINGELNDWKKNPLECLAFIILIDQFSRNIYRNEFKSFEFDSISLDFCKFGLKKLYLQNLQTEDQKLFFILPLIHCENLKEQELAISILHSELKYHSNLKKVDKFFQRHKEIIEIFGRFPHRNKILDRQSTIKEINFLKTPFSSF